MLDEKTQAAVKGKDADFILMLQKGLDKRAESRNLADRAEDMKREAEDLLLQAMSVLEIKKATDPVLGSVDLKQDFERSSFSKKVMSEYLLTHGVSADLVKQAQEEATKKTPVPFQLSFRPASS